MEKWKNRKKKWRNVERRLFPFEAAQRNENEQTGKLGRISGWWPPWFLRFCFYPILSFWGGDWGGNRGLYCWWAGQWVLLFSLFWKNFEIFLCEAKLG